jgi:hypothetical protein
MLNRQENPWQYSKPLFSKMMLSAEYKLVKQIHLPTQCMGHRGCLRIILLGCVTDGVWVIEEGGVIGINIPN